MMLSGIKRGKKKTAPTAAAVPTVPRDANLAAAAALQAEWKTTATMPKEEEYTSKGQVIQLTTTSAPALTVFQESEMTAAQLAAYERRTAATDAMGAYYEETKALLRSKKRKNAADSDEEVATWQDRNLAHKKSSAAATDQAQKRWQARQDALQAKQGRLATQSWWWLASSRFDSASLVQLNQHVSLVLAPLRQSWHAKALKYPHMYLVPTQAVPSLATCEEEVWAEMQLVQKQLRAWTKAQGKGIVFAEVELPSGSSSTAAFYQARLHAMVVPRRLHQDVALVVTSALQELLVDDSTHQKSIRRIDHRPLPRLVPAKFPYLYVEWDDGDGRWLVLDERMRSVTHDWAADVLAGALGLDPRRMRQQSDKDDNMSKRVLTIQHELEESVAQVADTITTKGADTSKPPPSSPSSLRRSGQDRSGGGASKLGHLASSSVTYIVLLICVMWSFRGVHAWMTQLSAGRHSYLTDGLTWKRWENSHVGGRHPSVSTTTNSFYNALTTGTAISMESSETSSSSSSTSIGVSPRVELKTFSYKNYTLAYLYKEASPEFRQSPPILLIHPVGIGISSWFWERLMEQAGPTMYAVDLIGCGLAHGADAWDPQQQGMSIPLEWVRACEALIQEVLLASLSEPSFLPWIPTSRMKGSPQKYAVMTQGGLAPVGVLMAARNLECVSHLILASPPTDLTTAVSEKVLTRNYSFFTGRFTAPVAFGLLETREAIQFFSNLFLFDQPCDSSWLDQATLEARVAARPPVQAFNAGFCQARSYRPELDAIAKSKLPVLVLQGQKDTARNGDRTEYYRQQVPHCRILTLSGKNVLPWESSTATIQSLCDFLTSKPSSGEEWGSKGIFDDLAPSDTGRRAMLSVLIGGLTTRSLGPQPSQAAVGSLPEYKDTNVILQGVTVRVADKSQQDAMIKFMTDAFDAIVLRKRVRGSVEETWIGFGPEQLDVPDDFEVPVSSFAKYGGHSSVHLVYDDRMTSPLYRVGDEAPGTNVAYLQLGVPQYRISQMVTNGGNILDAYGIVNVVSPSGLPVRGIVGISPDPIMLIALNCPNVAETQAFYEKLGFVVQEYPYARPNRGSGQFEPPQPAKSVYLAPTISGMGILLLPSKKKRVDPNPVVSSLNLVYTPADGAGDASVGMLLDPSSVPIKFQSVKDFVSEEKVTR